MPALQVAQPAQLPRALLPVRERVPGPLLLPASTPVLTTREPVLLPQRWRLPRLLRLREEWRATQPAQLPRWSRRWAQRAPHLRWLPKERGRLRVRWLVSHSRQH